MTTPRLPQALGLLAEVVRQPDFADAELQRAKSQAIDDLRLRLSRPTALASLAASRGVFGEGAYGHSRSGTPESLKRISRADVQQLHDALYRPDNAILILAGDITQAQAQQLAQASFGDWAKPATPLPPRPAGKAASVLPPLLLIDQHGAGGAGVVAAHAAPPRADADYYVGSVADAVLGDSYSARLNEEIRIKRGLSYGANSRLQGLGDAGIWLASAQTKNPSAPQVVELMLGQFKQLGDSRVGTDELAARKATLIGGYGRPAGDHGRLGRAGRRSGDLRSAAGRHRQVRRRSAGGDAEAGREVRPKAPARRPSARGGRGRCHAVRRGDPQGPPQGGVAAVHRAGSGQPQPAGAGHALSPAGRRRGNPCTCRGIPWARASCARCAVGARGTFRRHPPLGFTSV
ncbi:M16 family metallopeptidase [Rhodanobacter lindaniclasticus]